MYWLLNQGSHPFQALTREDLIHEIIKCDWKFPDTFSEFLLFSVKYSFTNGFIIIKACKRFFFEIDMQTAGSEIYC